MNYTYPEIRDVFAICAESTVADKNTNRGYIRPRSDGMGKILQNVLSMNGVRFQIKPGAVSVVSGASVQEITFDLGQSRMIDTTVCEMTEDLDLPMRVNNMFKKAANYNPNVQREKEDEDQKRRKAVEELKGIVTKIEYNVRSSDGGKWFYFYMPADKLKLAQDLFYDAGMLTQSHVSRLDGLEQTVLRFPSVMVPGYAKEIISKLGEHIKNNQKRDDLEDEENFARLTEIVTAVKTARSGDNVVYYYFYFPYRCLDEAQNLLGRVGVSTERHVSHADGIEVTVLRCPISETVRPVAERLQHYARVDKQAMKRLKEIVRGVWKGRDAVYSSLENIYFSFPYESSKEAQDLLAKLGLKIYRGTQQDGGAKSPNGLNTIKCQSWDNHPSIFNFVYNELNHAVEARKQPGQQNYMRNDGGRVI